MIGEHHLKKRYNAIKEKLEKARKVPEKKKQDPVQTKPELVDWKPIAYRASIHPGGSSLLRFLHEFAAVNTMDPNLASKAAIAKYAEIMNARGTRTAQELGHRAKEADGAIDAAKTTKKLEIPAFVPERDKAQRVWQESQGLRGELTGLRDRLEALKKKGFVMNPKNSGKVETVANAANSVLGGPEATQDKPAPRQQPMSHAEVIQRVTGNVRRLKEFASNMKVETITENAEEKAETKEFREKLLERTGRLLSRINEFEARQNKKGSSNVKTQGSGQKTETTPKKNQNMSRVDPLTAETPSGTKVETVSQKKDTVNHSSSGSVPISKLSVTEGMREIEPSTVREIRPLYRPEPKKFEELGLKESNGVWVVPDKVMGEIGQLKADYGDDLYSDMLGFYSDMYDPSKTPKEWYDSFTANSHESDEPTKFFASAMHYNPKSFEYASKHKKTESQPNTAPIKSKNRLK